jgi:hypothetical protein
MKPNSCACYGSNDIHECYCNLKNNNMKNIHVLPTDKPSRLHLGNSGLVLCDLNFGKNTINGQNIYITSDEKIKEGDWCIDKHNVVYKQETDKFFTEFTGAKKIILTTDQDLIKYGVQCIDDKFLEWFVKNPSCESVEIERTLNDYWKNLQLHYEFNYKIIIPKEEFKQLTLEEAAEKLYSEDIMWGMDLNKDTKNAFIQGAKWQEERMYSDEDMQEYAEFCVQCFIKNLPCIIAKDWFEQFKKD